jgi:hypothetical protein
MSDANNLEMVRVFAHSLNFHCPVAKMLLYKALNGKVTEAAAPAVVCIKIESMAGIELIPHLHIGPQELVTAVKKRIAALCFDFSEESMVLFYTPEENSTSKEGGGGGSKGAMLMCEVPEYDADGNPQAMVNVVALNNTIYIARASPHTMKQITTCKEYIECPRCKHNGPSRYTGHTKCETCECCGMCCIAVDHCGVLMDVERPVYEPSRKRLAAKQKEYLMQFHMWQRGIMEWNLS